MDSGDGLSNRSGGTVELNTEQIQHVFTKMSSDEQKEVQTLLKNCTTEITMTRGIPVTAGILGAFYFARSRLPPQYHFGPKGWPFYAIMGIASLTTTNVLFMSTCRDRVKPKLMEMWNKYEYVASSKDTRTTYDNLRQRHRQRQGDPGIAIPVGSESEGQQKHASAYDSYQSHQPATQDAGYASMMSGNTYDFTQPPIDGQGKGKRPPPVSFAYDDGGPSYMSGTPSGQRANTYNDQGFS